jgi:hypothetical protein
MNFDEMFCCVGIIIQVDGNLQINKDTNYQTTGKELMNKLS